MRSRTQIVAVSIAVWLGFGHGISEAAANVSPVTQDLQGLGVLAAAFLVLGALIALATVIVRRRRRVAATERAARDASLLFRGLYDGPTDATLMFRVMAEDDIRLESWNAVAAQALGIAPASLAGARLDDLSREGRLVDLAGSVRQAARRGLASRTDERDARSAEAVYIPLRDPATQAVARVFVGIRDITHLTVAATEAREANRLLVMAEQVAHFGHWHIDLPSRRLKWSDEVYRIHGQDPARFTPSLVNGVAAYLPEDRARVAASVARAIERDEGFALALNLTRPDGEVRHVLLRGICQFQRDAEGRPETLRSVFGVLADLTDLKQAEQALADKSALLEAILESMDQGLLMVAADGTVPVVNHRAVEMLALPPEMMATRPDYRKVRQHLRGTGAWGVSIQDPKHWLLDENRRTTDLRSERRRADGSVIEVRSLPMHTGTGYIQTLTDITDRRRADERLRESEARYRLLANYTSDLIVLDDVNGRHLYISPAVTSMLGYALDEATSLGLRTLVHREDIANLSATLHALRPEAPTGSVVYRLHHKSGDLIWVEAVFRRIEEHGDVQIIQAIRDVSQRQLQAADLQRARAAAEAGARAKAEFLANMSHELRTPLTGILGVHDLLGSDPTLTAQQARLVELAQESGHSLLTIVNDILDFSKIEAGQLVIEALPFGLRALVESCRELSIETVRGRNVTVAVEVADDVPDWLIGDPTRLRQVILNLATNAIKFTPQGRVTLRATWRAEPGVEQAGPGEVWRGERRPRLRVAVTDTGIGIAPETLPLLFERFAQADNSTSRQYGGTGLGLTICKRLVRLMGGEIGASSRLGEGSTFWFEIPLPLAQARHRAESTLRNALSTPTTMSRRLLLAEDNPLNQEIIGTVLRQKGHVVLVVDDGERAVSAALAEPRVDLVLMDVQMPGQDGLSATQVIRTLEGANGRSRVPIVALTANAMAEEIERCRAAGMDAHIAKPVDWTILFSTIDTLLSDGVPSGAPARFATRD